MSLLVGFISIWEIDEQGQGCDNQDGYPLHPATVSASFAMEGRAYREGPLHQWAWRWAVFCQGLVAPSTLEGAVALEGTDGDDACSFSFGLHAHHLPLSSSLILSHMERTNRVTVAPMMSDANVISQPSHFMVSSLRCGQGTLPSI